MIVLRIFFFFKKKKKTQQQQAEKFAQSMQAIQNQGDASAQRRLELVTVLHERALLEQEHTSKSSSKQQTQQTNACVVL